MIKYYIDAINGLDTNEGLSKYSAFNTLQAMLNGIATFTEDTTIYLGEGEYVCNQSIVTRISKGITVTVVGNGLKTTLKPSEAFGFNDANIGVSGAVLTFNKFILDMTYMITSNNHQSMYNNFNMNNVVCIVKAGTRYSSFYPLSNAIYTFTNCIAVGTHDLSLRTDEGKIYLYNCYGRFKDGYATGQSSWDIQNNVITTNPLVNEDYSILDDNIPSSIGVYNGVYTWLISILIKSNNQYYSILPEFYDIEMQQYLPLETLDFSKGFDVGDLFKTITIREDDEIVNPVMTSNTTPSPYVVSASSSFGANYDGWKAFNNLYDTYDSWVTARNITTGWIAIDLGASKPINCFKVTSRNANITQNEAPKDFSLQGSNDGINFDIIKEFTSETNWGQGETRHYELDSTVSYRFYKLDITSNNGYTTEVAVNELQLINTNILAQFLPIDKFDNFQLIYNNTPENANIKTDVKAIKSSRELIIANDDIYLNVAENIDSFKISTFSLSQNGIRMALSIDSGVTWKTFDGTVFSDLIGSAPLKELSEMSESELAQWSALRDEIYTNGMSPEIFNSIDFNILNSENIRFAYVIDKLSYEDVVEVNQLEWRFDAKGSMQNMKESEYTIDLIEEQIKITSLTDTDIVKANIIV